MPHEISSSILNPILKIKNKETNKGSDPRNCNVKKRFLENGPGGNNRN